MTLTGSSYYLNSFKITCISEQLQTWAGYLTVEPVWILGSKRPKSELCSALATQDLNLGWFYIDFKNFLSDKFSKRVKKPIHFSKP